MDLRQPEILQHFRLSGPHPGFCCGLAVVISEQVQHTMHD
jgi:hypothetical protein